MAFQVEQISPIQRKLNFTVPANEVSSELDRAFRDMAQKVRLRGFRPGKAPRSVLEARYGRSIKQEVAANLINNSFREAADALEFFGQPNVEKGDLVRGTDFSFSITVEVRPELELAPYKGVPVDFPVRTVAEGVVEANISQRLESQKSLAEVDRNEVEIGDYVLAEVKVTEGFNGDVGVVPRQFLREFVNQMDLVDENDDYDPSAAAGFAPVDLTPQEQALRSGEVASEDNGSVDSDLVPVLDAW